MTSNHRSRDLGRQLWFAAISIFLTVAALSPVNAAQPSYVLTDLGDLVGNAPIFTSHGSTAYGINSFGQVSGSSTTVLPNGNGGPVHAFLWTPNTPNGTTGNMVDLSPASGGIDDGDTVRINSFGQVLFTDGSTLPGVQRAPVLWTPATQNATTGTATALVSVTSDGLGLNDLGQVVGRMFPGLCFAWTPSQLNGVGGSVNHHFDSARQQDIPGYGFGACSNAIAINDVGQVTGSVGVGFWFRPFIHVNNAISFPNAGPLELGSIEVGDIVGPGPNTDPNDPTWSGGGNAINNKGHVVGSTVISGLGVHPFFFDGTTLRDIAPTTGAGGAALGINASDQVVGQAIFPAPGGAFLYDQGTLYQLFSLVESASVQGWSQLATAYAINDLGQIVGEGIHNGQGRAFLATPVGAPPPPATTISTQASPAVTLGNLISDSATVNAAVSPTGSITFHLYGPNDPTCSIVPPSFFPLTLGTNGSGNYLSGPFAPTAAGTYRWVAQYAGDAVTNPFTTACNDPNEGVVVSPVIGACATDVTSQVKIGFGPLKPAGGANFWQIVTLTNIGSVPLPGRLSFVIDNLSANAALANATGNTACATPGGHPYEDSFIALSPGGSVMQTLLFSDPSLVPITYSAWRVLAGPNPR
jgi:uncharacterized membrane protein